MNHHKATAIAALKEAGYNTRMVSIQIGGYLDTSVTATIRDESVDYNKVETIIKSLSRVDRCEASGEILGGGNVYTNVKVVEPVLDAWAKTYLEEVQAMLPNLSERSGSNTKDNKFTLYKDRSYVKIWGRGRDMWLDLNYGVWDYRGIAVDMFLENKRLEVKA